jgi:AcrR family transcriptional regulator
VLPTVATLPFHWAQLDSKHYRIVNAIVRTMPVRERVRRRRREEVREDLLAAAARVFAHRGFHGASVEAISEDAGLSTGAIYSNFASKEELFLALYEERIERRRQELRSAVEDAGGREAGLAAAAANVEAVFGREPEWFLLYFEFALHAARDAAFARRFRKIRVAGLRELERGVAEGLEHAGIEPSHATDLARGLRALSYGLALDGLVGERKGAESVFGRLVELIFRGLASETQSAPKASR